MNAKKVLKKSVCDNLVISSIDVVTAINKLKNNFSCGPDGIPSALLKNCYSSLVFPLCELFNTSLSTGIFPDVWKKSYITPIFK